jgi:hypothetical protein
MFGSFLPNLWSSCNQSVRSKEPTLLCNQVQRQHEPRRLSGPNAKMSQKPTPTFPRDKVVHWEVHFRFARLKYRHFDICAVIGRDIRFSLFRVADALSVSEVQKIGRFHCRAEEQTPSLPRSNPARRCFLPVVPANKAQSDIVNSYSTSVYNFKTDAVYVANKYTNDVENENPRQYPQYAT